jgi:hypothetical protein
MTAVPSWDLVDPRHTDAELVGASVAGDRAAFAQIYDRYADRLHDFCVGMLRDFDAAADCVQETFCLAATRLPQLRESPTNCAHGCTRSRATNRCACCGIASAKRHLTNCRTSSPTTPAPKPWLHAPSSPI